MAWRDLTGAVDFGYLESYAGGDLALVDEVLEMFREQAALWMRLLDPGAPGGAWRDAAHTLKGAALGIGAGALAEACAAAELAQDASPRDKQAQLNRIRDAADRALSDIAAYAHERALQSLKSPRGRAD